MSRVAERTGQHWARRVVTSIPQSRILAVNKILGHNFVTKYGTKQGIGVWVIGLLVTIIAIGLGAIFGTQYNILDRVQLPRIPVSTDDLSMGGIITAIAVLVLTLLAAMAGGAIGHRYHNRVDRVAGI